MTKIITAKMTKKAQKQEKVGKSGKKWEIVKFFPTEETQSYQGFEGGRWESGKKNTIVA